MGLPEACAALKASAEKGTAELAQAEANGAARAATTALAINAPFKNLRVKIIFHSVVGRCPLASPRWRRAGLGLVTRPTGAMLPDHARGKSGLAPRRLDFLL